MSVALDKWRRGEPVTLADKIADVRDAAELDAMRAACLGRGPLGPDDLAAFARRRAELSRREAAR